MASGGGLAGEKTDQEKRRDGGVLIVGVAGEEREEGGEKGSGRRMGGDRLGARPGKGADAID